MLTSNFVCLHYTIYVYIDLKTVLYVDFKLWILCWPWTLCLMVMLQITDQQFIGWLWNSSCWTLNISFIDHSRVFLLLNSKQRKSKCSCIWKLTYISCCFCMPDVSSIYILLGIITVFQWFPAVTVQSDRTGPRSCFTCFQSVWEPVWPWQHWRFHGNPSLHEQWSQDRRS